VRRRTNLLITGAGGSGKTTLLGALLARADPRERIVLVEDVAELRVRHAHVVSLEARQANIEGAGELSLPRLVREALRMRPDRLVVGECRGSEIRELLGALNTGHDGGAGTLHANGVADVPARLEALGALAGMDAVTTARQAVSAIGLVIHLARTPQGRRVTAAGRLATGDDGRLRVMPVRWDPGAVPMAQPAVAASASDARRTGA
jgi:pilus assembly protein CpaF